MRDLTDAEVGCMDETREDMEPYGYKAVEITIQELADMEAGTACGRQHNKCFIFLASEGFGDVICRGWLKEIDPEWGPIVNGMFHMELRTNRIAERIDGLSGKYHGSLRFNGNSFGFNGFKEFEIE